MIRLTTICAAFLLVTVAHAAPVIRQDVVMENDAMPSPEVEASPPLDVELVLPTRSLGPSFKINAGGDAFGEFQSDFYAWISGEIGSYFASNSTVVGDADVPTRVYASHRHGLLMVPFGYDLPLSTPGVYDCALYFGESYPEYFFEGGRTFSISATGAADPMVVKDIDMFLATEGDITKPVVQKFNGIHATDMISFYITPSAGEAFLSGISCNKVEDL